MRPDRAAEIVHNATGKKTSNTSIVQLKSIRAGNRRARTFCPNDKNVKNDKTKAVVNYPKSANFNSGKLQEYWSDKIRALSERYYDHNKETTARYEQGLTILRQLQSKDTDPTNSKKKQSQLPSLLT